VGRSPAETFAERSAFDFLNSAKTVGGSRTWMAGSPYYPENRPTASVVLSIVAAVLMFGDAIFVLALGNAATSLGYRGAGGVLGGLGILELIFGLVVLLLAIFLYRNPDSHVGCGIAILILSLVSVVGGGGFLLGIVLGLTGGVLAIVFEPGAGRPLPAPPMSPAWTPAWSPGLPPPPPRFATPLPGGRPTSCARCGSSLLPTDRTCPRCDAPLP
jgi:hypothetical protein